MKRNVLEVATNHKITKSQITNEIILTLSGIKKFDLAYFENLWKPWNRSRWENSSRVYHGVSMSANHKTATKIQKFNLFQDVLWKPLFVLGVFGNNPPLLRCEVKTAKSTLLHMTGKKWVGLKVWSAITLDEKFCLTCSFLQKFGNSIDFMEIFKQSKKNYQGGGVNYGFTYP